VFELAERVMQTHDAYGAANEALNPTETAFIEWMKNNPAPDKEVFQAADKAEAAMARWRRRRRAAKRRTGLEKAETNQNAACQAAWDAIETLRDTVPQTLEGLAAKARAWRDLETDIQEQADELVYSLANDISVMAGEIGPGESDQKTE
jgi:hypothetical protein